MLLKMDAILKELLDHNFTSGCFKESATHLLKCKVKLQMKSWNMWRGYFSENEQQSVSPASGSDGALFRSVKPSDGGI